MTWTLLWKFSISQSQIPGNVAWLSLLCLFISLLLLTLFIVQPKEKHMTSQQGPKGKHLNTYQSQLKENDQLATQCVMDLRVAGAPHGEFKIIWLNSLGRFALEKQLSFHGDSITICAWISCGKTLSYEGYVPKRCSLGISSLYSLRKGIIGCAG